MGAINWAPLVKQIIYLAGYKRTRLGVFHFNMSVIHSLFFVPNSCAILAPRNRRANIRFAW